MHLHDLLNLTGRIALVTGGAGLFGKQIVLGLAEAGATVVVASRDEAKLQAFEKELAEQGVKIHVHPVDQSDEASLIALKAHIESAIGPVDILVNNAVARVGCGWQAPLERFEESMRINATGLFAITRLFGEAMAERGRGSIINIGSIQGHVGPDYTLYEGTAMGSAPDYFLHKGGMLNFTRFVAATLGPRGVRCNTITPGGFFNHQDPQFIARYNRRTFLDRMANDHDLKGAVVLLASDAAAYITGADLVVDGGYLAK